MEKKSEVKTATNAELILSLSRMFVTGKILKSDQKRAKRIFDELEKRGIIEDAASVFEQWNAAYTC